MRPDFVQQARLRGRRGVDAVVLHQVPNGLQLLGIACVVLAGIAAEDIGKCAYGIFKEGAPTIGQRIGIMAGSLLGGLLYERAGEPAMLTASALLVAGAMACVLVSRDLLAGSGVAGGR